MGMESFGLKGRDLEKQHNGCDCRLNWTLYIDMANGP